MVATVLAALLTYMPEMLLFAGATALAPPTDGAYYLDVAVGTLRSARPAGPPAPSHALARDRRQYGVRGVPAPRAPRPARLVGLEAECVFLSPNQRPRGPRIQL